MIKRNFASTNLEKLYNHMLKNPPINKDGLRIKGSLLNREFWFGYDGIKLQPQKTSFALMAYWAGQDYKKQEGLT